MFKWIDLFIYYGNMFISFFPQECHQSNFIFGFRSSNRSPKPSQKIHLSLNMDLSIHRMILQLII